MIGATMWQGLHQVAQKSTTVSPLYCSTSAWNVVSVMVVGCFMFSITLHAPSIDVSLLFYESVGRSCRHRRHENLRRPAFLPRRPGTRFGTARVRRWRHDRPPAVRRHRGRTARAE